MQKVNILLACSLLGLLGGCVQETRQRTVRYKLYVPGQTVETAGVRGNDDPLDWDRDSSLTRSETDSFYTTTVTYNTGLRFTKVKFFVNGKRELEGKESRRVNFVEGDTTVFEAVFDKEKP